MFRFFKMADVRHLARSILYFPKMEILTAAMVCMVSMRHRTKFCTRRKVMKLCDRFVSGKIVGRILKQTALSIWSNR